MHSTSFLIRKNFIIKLGKALHKFGTPAFRLEKHLSAVAEALSLRGHFLVMPTSLTFVLWTPEDMQEHTSVARVQPGDIDLGKLAQTNQLSEAVIADNMDLEQAVMQLSQIEEQGERYSPLTTMFGFAVTGGAFAMLMNSSTNSIIAASLLSLISYALVFYAGRSRRIAVSIEPLAALLCAFAAVALSQWLDDLNIPIVILSAIIIFIPGLALTLGLNELAARELVSGTARIMDGCMVMFKLYFGALLGLTLGSLTFQRVDIIPATDSIWWLSWLGVLLLSCTLTIVFKVREKDIVWGILSGIIAYSVTIIGSHYLGDALGPFIGAFAVGVYSNLFSQLTRSPASVVLLQGIVLLVPGSKAYISLNTLVLGENMVSIPNIGSQTFLIFMSIVAGLLFANLAVPQRGSL